MCLGSEVAKEAETVLQDAMGRLVTESEFMPENQPHTAMDKISATEVHVGGLYARASEHVEDAFQVCQVLLVDEFAVHVKVFLNIIGCALEDIRLGMLSEVTLHAPIARHSFLEGQQLVGIYQLSEDELEGYHVYVEQVGDTADARKEARWESMDHYHEVMMGQASRELLARLILSSLEGDHASAAQE
ncbi:hypothetical protein FVE85_6855 [Porphyridium purpureum]|uniref:Uncharacterized protein n=1 Tax=Porphyridium purpureum TaxID=35688 RepID=A0A5J4Z842_PORPP|nr:hypothetical protein FVE85_6855 [Porphyridium purpureum]|eukprot:POR0813..scf295_1